MHAPKYHQEKLLQPIMSQHVALHHALNSEWTSTIYSANA